MDRIRKRVRKDGLTLNGSDVFAMRRACRHPVDDWGANMKKNLWKLVLPVTFQQFMLALVGASDALMLGRLSQTFYLRCPLLLRLPLSSICLWRRW